MKTKYAKLELYYGLCGAGGGAEGKFSESKFLKDNLQEYRESVDKAISWGMITFCKGSLCRNLKEVQSLTSFIKESFPKSNEDITLYDVKHGKTMFHSFINVPRNEIQTKISLVNKLMESGHQPLGLYKWKIKDKLTYLKIIRNKRENETLSEAVLKGMRKCEKNARQKLHELTIQEWKRHLTF